MATSLTRPAFFKTFRCWDTAGLEIGIARASSTTALGDSRRLSKIVRRVGSLKTPKISPAALVRLDLRFVVTYAVMVMHSAPNMAASRRLYEEVFGRGHVEVADEILAPDIVSHGPGSPPVVGTEQIKRQAMVLRGAFPDLTIELADQFASGDRVCSRWSARGTHTGELRMPGVEVPATGRPIGFEEIRIDRFAEGSIVESWFIPDRFSLWLALGLIQPVSISAPPDRRLG